MDLSELHKSYLRGATRSLTEIWRSAAVLRREPSHAEALEVMFRAAHSIKGSSWAMRDAPYQLNDEPIDELYATAADAAEELETYLLAVRAGELVFEQVRLVPWLARLEAAVAAVGIRLAPLTEEQPSGAGKN